MCVWPDILGMIALGFFSRALHRTALFFSLSLLLSLVSIRKGKQESGERKRRDHKSRESQGGANAASEWNKCSMTLFSDGVAPIARPDGALGDYDTAFMF